jgi:SprT protein
MDIIKPIDNARKQRVVDETGYCIQKACELFNRSFALIPVSFNIRGRAVGMYRANKHQREIRYNPWLFAKYFDDNLENTVPHEVAHYIIDVVYGHGSRSITPLTREVSRFAPSMNIGQGHHVRPHGKEWQALMNEFGADAKRTYSYDLGGIPVRRQKQYNYHCACNTYQLSTHRHNKINRNAARYFCRQCRDELVLQ